MSDLVFKNIPAEGFDPQTGFSERLSNSTPSRSHTFTDTPTNEISTPISDDRLSNLSVRPRNNDMDFSEDMSRLSTPTPSHKQMLITDENETISQMNMSSETDPLSRASNPTPTRRRAKSNFDASVSEKRSAFEVFAADDPYSRVSLPTPTRREINFTPLPDAPISGTIDGVDMNRVSNPTPRRRDTGENQGLPDSVPMNFVADEHFSRASNSTPTRRCDNAAVIPEESSVIDETLSLSFASVTDSYDKELTEDARASNPTPTRRIFGSDNAPSNDEYDDNSRLSNISPSSRK